MLTWIEQKFIRLHCSDSLSLFVLIVGLYFDVYVSTTPLEGFG